MIHAFGLPSLGRAMALLSLFWFQSATAGPLEDGVKAYSRAEYATAVRLLMPLAEKGNIDAQFTVALMYAKGLGVAEDKVRAYMWYDLAARTGDKDAASDRDALGSGMTPDQVAEAKRLAAEWKAK
jgi:localization factor PodJL